MRKLLSFISAISITASLSAGGLVTNTNQSASWVRMPSRNASVNIDAVYYNPAGLMKLNNGLHLSVSNQSIFQTRTIKNWYEGPGNAYGLNDHVYEGTVTAIAFPDIYAVYKLDKFAFSLGFEPVGGGGGAEYERGLPSFEMSPSDLVPSLKSQGAQAYRLDAYFKGSSTFLGLQGAVSYKVNDWLSVAAGLRYVTAKNTYEGHLKDVEVYMPGDNWIRADVILGGAATTYTTAAGGSTQLVAAGAGALTFAQAQTAGYISPTQRAQFEAALVAVGYPAATPIAQADLIYKGTALKYTQSATLLGDQTADVEQNGSGIAPIFSVNISPSENLNIAVKYEMATKLELENSTTEDLLIGYEADGTPITMFPDGALTRNDMPATLTLGINYKASDAITLAAGANYYFDKAADYGKKTDHDINSSTPAIPIANSEIIDHNGLSIHAAIEGKVSDKFLLSCGYVWANKGVNDKYQSDLSYGLATQSVGFGGAYSFTEKIQLNLGLGYTYYKDDEKYVNHTLGSTLYKPLESYGKNTWMVGVGLDFSF
jgi:long-subunit fatty acid transport protein